MTKYELVEENEYGRVLRSCYQSFEGTGYGDIQLQSLF